MTTNNTKTCRNCKTDNGSERKYPWYCTPKKKYNEAPYWTEFTIKLCDACYQKTTDCKSVNGWDWWDAYDDLDYTYLQPQSYRDRYDKGTAKVLGFETVEGLRQARQDNRLAWEETKYNRKTQDLDFIVFLERKTQEEYPTYMKSGYDSYLKVAPENRMSWDSLDAETKETYRKQQFLNDKWHQYTKNE